jgi:alkaline phosphatase D
MRHFSLTIFLLLTALSYSQDSISRIAFGSCQHQDKPLEILKTVLLHDPDLFIYLGDNIYGDTDNMCVLKKKYRILGKNKNFQSLRKSVPVIATWDDHDYGQDDIGKYYPKKKQSKKIFLNFFKEPKGSLRYDHEGIYTSYEYQINGKVLQIILLDCRTFRSNLLPYNGSLKKDTCYHYHLDYSQYMRSDSTMLGATQWKWLEEQLKKPADIRIIGSSTQFATQYNGYEAWANFPFEQLRMLDMIQRTNANGVFFISGDVHYAELSKLEQAGLYPIYDLTCSGITEEWKFATPNMFRVDKPVMDNHFGIIDIDWSRETPMISLEVWDKNDQRRIQQIVPLSELQIKK